MKILASLTAVLTLALILAGGFVTTTRTGDTIPTWPLSWGSLVPPSFAGGVGVEWGHRLLAGIVGLLVAAVATLAWRVRSPYRGMAAAAFAAVLVQALIGGLRIYVPQAAVAVVHAILGQLVFCTMVALALFLSRAWRETPSSDDTSAARGLAAVATGAAFLQVVAGAVTRHTGAGILVHLTGAGVVVVLEAILASRLMLTPLRRVALALLAILGVQFLLGVAAWAITSSGFVRSHESPLLQIVTVTAHVAVGALLLGTNLAVTLMCHRQKAADLKPVLA